jgi:hypothetical protein
MKLGELNLPVTLDTCPVYDNAGGLVKKSIGELKKKKKVGEGRECQQGVSPGFYRPMV